MRRMFGKKLRRKSEQMEIDITSLLDILVILLVFLLKSYNSTNLKLDMVKEITLPESKVRNLGAHAVIVQVDSQQRVYVGNKELGRIPSGQKVDVLFDYLQREKQIQEKSLPQGEKPSKQINLVLHKDLPYEAIKKVLHTSASAGFTEYKLLVTGNY